MERGRDRGFGDDRMMLPCRRYMSGFCPSGSRCRFYHPAQNQLATAIRVPPMPPDFGSRAALFPSRSVSGIHYPPRPTFDIRPPVRPTHRYNGREPDLIMCKYDLIETFGCKVQLI